MTRLETLVTRPPRVATLLRISAVATLVGLAFMVWSMVQPTPMPVILAMSVGQVLGLLAFALFGVAVLIDQIRKQRAKGKTMTTGEIAAGEAVLGPGARDASSGSRTPRPDGSPPAREVSP